MAEFNKIIGNAIKLLREELGMTQAQLADRAGVNQQTIDRIERARFNSSISLIQQVLQAMGTTLMIAPVEISDQERFLLHKHFALASEKPGHINTGAGGVAKVEAHGDIIAVYEKLVTELRADKARLIEQNEKLIQMLADKK